MFQLPTDVGIVPSRQPERQTDSPPNQQPETGRQLASCTEHMDLDSADRSWSSFQCYPWPHRVFRSCVRVPRHPPSLHILLPPQLHFLCLMVALQTRPSYHWLLLYYMPPFSGWAVECCPSWACASTLCLADRDTAIRSILPPGLVTICPDGKVVSEDAHEEQQRSLASKATPKSISPSS